MVFWILPWSKSHSEQFSQVERSGDEFLDCKGEKRLLVEKDHDLSEEQNIEEDQVPIRAADKTPENHGNQDNKQQSNNISSTLQLTPLHENEDLIKDAKFIKELGITVQKEETSTRLTP